MRKLSAAMRKEFLLLIRDKMGLSILFIMPMVLIVIMTLIQDAAFRTVNEEGIPLLVVNEDQDSLGFRIEAGLKNSDLVAFHNEINGKRATRDELFKAVKEGKFLIGIVIPKGTTKAIQEDVKRLVDESLGEDVSQTKQRSTEIEMVIDPIASKSFVTSVTSQLREFISALKTRVMFETFNAQIAELIPDDVTIKKSEYSNKQAVTYKEVYASEISGEIKPNAVQHNIPAWTIFAMFFIVLPLVSSIMKEKEEGSVFRFHTIPASYFLQINAKLIVFIVICLIQFFLMLLIGLVFLPMLGLPVLQLGNSYSGILLMALGCALAASGFGVLVGSLATTQQQGAVLGSLSILIFSAIGGIWVPAYVMPSIMRRISEISPLKWAMDGFYGLFLRGEGCVDILPHFFKLAVFFAFCLAIAIRIQSKKRIG
ncbi:MAG: ABC transporter permease [Crocinitomicaceae bacterium]